MLEALQPGEPSEVLRPMCSGTQEQPRGGFHAEELGVPSFGLTLVGPGSASSSPDVARNRGYCFPFR